MWSCGSKRKLEEEDESNLSYFAQRQSVLNISMIKLRTQPLRKTEQPLRRSVLIFNTLKSIESELKMEGVHWNLPTRPSLLPSIQPLDVTLDPIPVEHINSDPADKMHPGVTGSQDRSPAMDTTLASSYSVQPAAVSTGGLASMASNSSELSQDINIGSGFGGQDTNSYFADSRSLLDGFFGTQSSAQSTLPTFSSLLDLDSTSSSSNVMDSNSSLLFSSSLSLPTSPSSSSGATTSSQLALPTDSSSLLSAPCEPMQHSNLKPSSSTTPASSTAAAASSSPSPPQQALGQAAAQVPPSTDQDLFSDFDFSSLDFDFFSFLPSNLKLPPLSPEDLQSLPHPETFPQSLASSCNPKHTDLLGDDLDSIMQILVGI